MLVSATPLAGTWFVSVQGLDPELASLCRMAVWIAVLMPGYQVIQSWYQGVLVHHRETRAITEAVGIYLVLAVGLLALGVAWQPTAGILYALASFVVAGVLQTLYLAARGERALRAAREGGGNRP